MSTLTKSTGWFHTCSRRRCSAALLLLCLATPSTAFGQAGAPGLNKGKAIVQQQDAAPRPERLSALIHMAAGGARRPLRNSATSGGGVVKREYGLVVDESYYEAAGAPLSGATPGQPTGRPAGHEITEALKVGRVSVLVHFDAALARGRSPRADIRAFCAANNGVVRYEYHAVMPNVINLRNIPQGKLKALANIPGVTRIDPDQWHPNLVRLHDATALVNGLQSQIAAAGLSVDGAGVRVCICDTGIDTDHLMYAGRIDSAAGFDFHNNDSNPEDDNGHGAHVSGIAVGGVGLTVDFGCGAGGQAFQGMAPAATLIGAKILNSAGGGFDSNIIAGINHCADQTPSGGRADVINLSIGTGNFSGGACTHIWAVAANNAVANGVVVVAASGNENNTNSMGSPACGADVIAVGAVYKADYPTCEDNVTDWNWTSCIDFGPVEDEIVCFSNESDFLDVSAPGANIWSASIAAGGSSITGKSGTSMASPMVAGLAALILDADPSLTPAEVRQIIRDGAVDLGPVGFDRAYGHGRIDAINSLLLVNPCDDGLTCTTDTFNSITMMCESTPDAGTCLIGGICFNDGDRNPANDCESCDSAVDQIDWTSLPTSTACDRDADACTGDVCDGFGTCVFDSFATQVDVNLEIDGLGNAVMRTVTLVITDCQGGTDTRPEPVNFDSVGLGSVSLLAVDPGADWIQAAEGHTLGKRLPVSINQAGGCAATVNFTSADRLISGDLSNAFVSQDNTIAIQDFAILSIEWNQAVSANLGTLADVTGDGAQGNLDFSVMVSHFAEAGDAPDLCPAPASLGRFGEVVRLDPTTRLLVDEATMPGAEQADLNADGVIDTRDIRAFAALHNLAMTPEVSARLARLEADSGTIDRAKNPEKTRPVRHRR